MPLSPNCLPLTSAPASLCILRLSALGDVCHTLPVVRTLQAHWPQTQITWVIGKLEATLVGDIPGIDFIIFDKAQGLGAYGQLRRQLRGRRFNVLLHMQVSLRASLASLLIRADIRLGFDKSRARDFQWLFTNARISATPRQHVMDGLFGFAERLGVKEHILHWDIPIPAEAEAFAKHYIKPGQATLVISPCSSSLARNWRNWHAAGYAQVVDYAHDHLGMQTILTGGASAEERRYGVQISALATAKPINLINQTNLKQLLAIIKQATVVLSPDSGPAHMATSVGTPVIGLYVTSNPLRTGPYLSQQWVVNKYPEAVRTEFHESVDNIPWGARVRNPDTMKLIRTEDVIAKLAKISQCLTAANTGNTDGQSDQD